MRTPLLVLALVWVASVLLVNPFGDFPLNDDWCYAAPARSLAEHGTYLPLGWTTITLVSQAAWGALFLLPFGFSYEALRLSTLVLGLAGVFGMFFLLRRVGGETREAVLGALVVAANPIYFALSHTFMSDVPFLAAMVFSLFFFVRSLQTESDRDLAAGALLAAAAVLCRKLGLFVPIAYAVVTVAGGRFSRRSLLRAAAPIALCLAALLGFEAWLRASGNMPAKYDMQTKVFWHILTRARGSLLTAHMRLIASTIYLGLFLLPVLFLASPFRERAPRRRLLAALLLGGIGSFVLLRGGALMPLGVNVLDRGGIGPVTLRDVFILGLPHAPALPAVFWGIVTVAGVAGGVFLIWFLAAGAAAAAARAPLRPGGRRVPAFLLLGALIYAAPLFADSMFDRYLLPLVPLFAAFLFSARGEAEGAAGARRPARLAPASAAILLFLVFAVCGTHDYLAWNRARWGALREWAQTEKIDPSRIDGGYEWNGVFTYEEDFRPVRGKSWWWVRDDAYVVAMGPLPGYSTLRETPYGRWMPPGRERVLVLRREARNEGGDPTGTTAP